MTGKPDRIAPALTKDVAPGMLLEAAERYGDLIAGADVGHVLSEGFVSVAHSIFLHADEAPRRALVARARRNPALAEALLSEVFPPVARMLGEAWASDQLSFVDVTIAAVRLQAAVRALMPQVGNRAVGAVALVVPPWEQHALPGALAIASLRRMGVDARVSPGATPAAIAADLARTPPQGVLVSVGSRRSAARLGDLIAMIRQAQLQRIPIIVGGPATALDSATCGRSGADLVTSDLQEALRFCRIELGSAHNERAGFDA